MDIFEKKTSRLELHGDGCRLVSDQVLESPQGDVLTKERGQDSSITLATCRVVGRHLEGDVPGEHPRAATLALVSIKVLGFKGIALGTLVHNQLAGARGNSDGLVSEPM